MSYEFRILKEAVYIGFYDDVDSYDLIRVHNDEKFIEGIRDIGRVIYDYSHASSINITQQELDTFAKLAVIESRLSELMIMAIIPQDPVNKARIEYYMQRVNPSDWEVFIAENVSHALTEMHNITNNH